MKDLAMFSLKLMFFILVSLGKLQQSICSCICLAYAIVNLEIVSRELLGLADLSRAQSFHIYEATKVIIICKDKDLMLTLF